MMRNILIAEAREPPFHLRTSVVVSVRNPKGHHYKFPHLGEKKYKEKKEK